MSSVPREQKSNRLARDPPAWDTAPIVTRRRVVLLTLLPLLLVGVGEVVARIRLGSRWSFGTLLRATWPDIEVREAKRGWAMRPRLTAELVGAHPPYEVVLDRRGYRQPDRAWARDATGLRVLALGDAVVYGWGVDAEDRFTERLERALVDSLEQHVEVWNLAVPGYAVDQSLWTYELDGRQLDADVVILYVALKDIALTETGQFRGIRKPRFAYEGGTWRREEAPPLTTPSAPLPWLTRLSRWSAMAAVVRERGAGPLPGPQEMTARIPWIESVSRPIVDDLARQAQRVLDPEAPIHQALLALNDRVRADGATLVLLGVPVGHDPYLMDPRFDAPPEGRREGALSRALGELAQRLGVESVRLDELFGREVERGARLHVGDGHPNAPAHALIAGALEPVVVRAARARDPR